MLYCMRMYDHVCTMLICIRGSTKTAERVGCAELFRPALEPFCNAVFILEQWPCYGWCMPRHLNFLA